MRQLAASKNVAIADVSFGLSAAIVANLTVAAVDAASKAIRGYANRPQPMRMVAIC